MLTLHQFQAVQTMARRGHQFSDFVGDHVNEISVHDWKSLKAWPTAGDAWRLHPISSFPAESSLIKGMTQSWQTHHSDASDFLPLAVDGVLGDRTVGDTFRTNLCGCPDIAGTRTFYEAKIGESSWDRACRFNLTYALQGGGFSLPGMSKDRVDWCITRAMGIIASEVEGVRFVRDQTRGENVNNFIRPAKLSPGVLARNTLPPSRNTQCGFWGWGEISTRVTWTREEYLTCVMIHEVGIHGLGALHGRSGTGAVSTSAINEQAVARTAAALRDPTLKVLNDEDWRLLRAEDYSPNTSGPVDPDEPIDPETGADFVLDGSLGLIDKKTGKTVKKFIVVPE